ncbi:hypothetical protein HDU87_004611 [Geranomyces variabilis]|uniref:Uncharacterized protein n=1 Tax=Geranomyces variabilis TaxID=109894 RepID=A0AAD5TJ77_9FUNG|nr:hypothetical protein HDU87_004611 [Geranomyces variabilis]
MVVAAAASGISSLHLLATGGTQCTAAQPTAAGTATCSDVNPIAIQPGTDATLVWTWTPAANATVAGDALPATFFLQDAQSEIVVADNVDATTQQIVFRIPVSPLLQGNVTIGAIQNGRRVTTASPAMALAAAAGAGGSSASIAHIALILGLCSVFGLVFLLAAFFGWRNWVRKRPGYARRKEQRTKGFSTVVVRRVKHFWNDSLLRSIGRRGAMQHSTYLAEESPVDRGDDDSDPIKTSRLTDIAVQPPQPCFRPSSDLLPPRLVRTYTWQEAETSSQSNLPLAHLDGEEHMLLPLRQGGWDEGPAPADAEFHSNSYPVIAHE